MQLSTLQKCVLFVICIQLFNDTFAQDFLKDLKKDWKSYNISGVGTIRLPTYIKPLNSIQNKIANGIAKEFQLPKNENNFAVSPDSNLNSTFSNSVFSLTVGSVDMDIIKQSSYLNFYDSSFLSHLEYVQLSNLKEKYNKLEGKIIKSYSPELDIIYDLPKSFAAKYYTLKTKYIVELPNFYEEPLTLFVIAIPNGNKSLIFEIIFSTYDSEFWYPEMESILKEVKLNTVVK